jgi:hypothetical protein
VTDKRRSFDERVASGEGVISILNQPLDFTVDFAVKAESAIERARQRWRMADRED